MNRETLTLSASEVRFDTTDAGSFSGYAARFDAPNSLNETIRAGAFRRSLLEHAERGTRPPMLWGHDPNKPVGVWTDLVEDSRGLKVSGRLVLDTTQGREAHALLKAGALSGLSIGFRARQQERGPGGRRQLLDIDLAEISLVTLPADREARITNVRHAASADLAAFTGAVRRAAEAFKR